MDLINKPDHPTYNGSLMFIRNDCMISVTLLPLLRSVKTAKATMSCSEPATHRSALESSDPVGNLNSSTFQLHGLGKFNYLL